MRAPLVVVQVGHSGFTLLRAQRDARARMADADLDAGLELLHARFISVVRRVVVQEGGVGVSVGWLARPGSASMPAAMA